MTIIQAPALRSFERDPRPSYSEFVAKFLPSRKPIIVTGAPSPWKAMSKWTQLCFNERCGSLPLVNPMNNCRGREAASGTAER